MTVSYKTEIPGILLKNKSFLKSPDDHSISFNSNTWKKVFQDDSDFQSIIRDFPEHLCRSDVGNFAKLAFEKGQSIRKVFLATMIWGYGTVGYGAYRTSKMLGEKYSYDLIKSSFNFVMEGNYIAAYETLSLPWCGSAFVSKFLYFSGLGNNISPLPLILDSVVSNSLEKLGLDISLFAKVTRTNSYINSLQKWSLGYQRYVELLNNWALNLKCRPDAIEKWLFSI
jgi:hypothetical protein